jgi:hypothetical protein
MKSALLRTAVPALITLLLVSVGAQAAPSLASWNDGLARQGLAK